MDIGATHHLTSDLSCLQVANGYNDDALVVLGNGATIPNTHLGSTSLSYGSHTLNLK